MKPFLVLALLLLIPASAGAQITNSTVYQAQFNLYGNGSAATSEVLAYGQANLAGSMLGAVVWWSGAVTLSVADSKVNTWTCRPDINITGNTHVRFCYAFGAIAGANTVTYSFSGAGATFIEVQQGEWTGVDTIDSLASGEATGSSATPTTPTVTTNQPGELLVTYAGLGSGNHTGWFASYPFSLLAIAAGGSGTGIANALADRHNVAAAGSYTHAFTAGTFDNWGTGIVAFYKTLPVAPIANQSDNFTRADENPLSNGGKWTTVLAATCSLKIVSNLVTNAASGGNGCSEYWNNVVFPDDQFSQTIVNAIDTSTNFSDQGPLVRISAASSDAFYFGSVFTATQNPLGGSQQLFLSRVVNSGEQVLAVTNQIVNSGDVIRIEARGPVFLEKLNGTVILVGVDTNASALESGFSGAHIFDGSGVGIHKMSTWTGGALGPALIGNATDTFDRGNGALGSNWVQAANSINVLTNVAVGNQPAAVNAAIYSGIEFIADQQAQATVSKLNGSDLIGVTVRSSGTTLSSANPSVGYACYDLVENTTTLSLRKTTITTAGVVTSTVLSTLGITGAVGDVLNLRIQGSNLSGFRNGAQVLTASDSAVLAGYPGIELFSTTATLNNFTSGSFPLGGVKVVGKTKLVGPAQAVY